MDELVQKYITKISTEKGISVKEASELIDRCIKQIALDKSVDYQVAYDAIYSPEYLSKCVMGRCDQLTIDQCYESCHCAVYKDQCIPREIEDAEIINRDPDKYANGLHIKALENLVEKAAFLSFNYDSSGLTDNSYDALEYHLNKRLKLKERRREKVGAPPIDRIRVDLPYQMPSLDKIKPGTRALQDFIQSCNAKIRPSSSNTTSSTSSGALGGFGGGVGSEGSSTNRGNKLVWSDKLDGVSGLVVYKGGAIVGVYVRGDGTVGGDITFVKDYITFPSNISFDLAVRGEFVVSRRVFGEKYSKNFATPRSFVVSKLNSGFVSPALVDVEFLAYQIISHKGVDMSDGDGAGSYMNTFRQLDIWGFKTPENGVFEPVKVGGAGGGVGGDDGDSAFECVLTFDIMMKYRKRRDESAYKIDGLVLNHGGGIAGGGVKAFKMLLEEQIRDTKITTIEWNISRYGRFVPVAVFESVFIDDVRLHRASAFNASHVRDWSMGRGTKIKIARSGDVIPHINDVTVDINVVPIYPSDEQGEWHWEPRDIVLNDIEGNKWVQIKRISYFFEVIGVPRLREGTVKNLWEGGLKTIESITQSTPKELIKIKGFGKKKSTDMYESIHSIMRKTRLDRFLAATTTFKTSIGRKLIIKLMSKYPSVIDDDEETIRANMKKNKIPGFGPKRIDGVASEMKKFRDFLYSLNEDDVKHAIEYNKKRVEQLSSNKNPTIDGKKFVLTGFMKTNYELEDYIFDNGGDISSVVTSDTAGVISNNILEISKKMLAASELKVKVYSIQEFNKFFGLKGEGGDAEGEGEGEGKGDEEEGWGSDEDDGDVGDDVSRKMRYNSDEECGEFVTGDSPFWCREQSDDDDSWRDE